MSALTKLTRDKFIPFLDTAEDEGNEMYDFIFKKFYDMPTGDAVKVPFLMCFGGTGKKAWRGICTLLLDTLDTVEGKISFTIKLGGEIEKGTYTIESGAPTFTAASD